MNKRQKKKQIKMRNKKLIKLHPYLLPRNVWTGKIVSRYDYTWTEYDCLSKGWKIGFGKFFLEDLREACLKTNFLNKLRFTDIKEKYGSARFYTFGVPQDVEEVLNKYEFISQYICYYCGSSEGCVVDDYGWYLPMCKCCWDKSNKKRLAKGYKIISWEEALGDNKVGLPNEYRMEYYSSEKSEIITYDISETVNKIKNRGR